MARQTTPTEKLDLRLTPAAKQMLQAAAAVSRRSVSRFVLESALARADEVLVGRRTFLLSTDRWRALMTALDVSPRSLPRVQRLLKEPGFFDTASKR